MADIERLNAAWQQVRADRETFDVSMLFYSLSVDAWTSDLQSDNDYGLFDGFRALEQTAVARQLQVLVDVATDVTDAAIEGQLVACHNQCQGILAFVKYFLV